GKDTRGVCWIDDPARRRIAIDCGGVVARDAPPVDVVRVGQAGPSLDARERGLDTRPVPPDLAAVDRVFVDDTLSGRVEYPEFLRIPGVPRMPGNPAPVPVLAKDGHEVLGTG